MANQINKVEMPVANQSIADQRSAAAALRTQAQFRNVQPQQAMSGGMQAAQALGAQSTEAQGQVQTSASAALANKEVREAANEMAVSNLKTKEHNEEMRRQFEQNRLNKEEELRGLGRDVQSKIVDAQYKFQRTARGLQFADERQYEDYLTLKNASEQEWQSHLQSAEQALKQKIQALQFAYDVFERYENEKFKKEEQTLDQASLIRVRKRKKEILEEQKKAQRKAGRMNQMMGVVQMAVGAGMVAASASTLVQSGGASWAMGTGGTQMMAQGAQQYQQGNAG